MGLSTNSLIAACVQITPVLPIMEQVWPSYYGPNEDFWAHEWEKHGTCAEDVFPTQLDYFNTTVELHLTHSVEARMNSALRNAYTQCAYNAFAATDDQDST